MSRALFPLLLALCAAAQVSDFDKMMEAKVAELVRKNGPGTNPQLRARLEGMRKADQEVRKARAKGHEPNSTAVGILHRLGLIDARGRVLYPTPDPDEGNGRPDASDA